MSDVGQVHEADKGGDEIKIQLSSHLESAWVTGTFKSLASIPITRTVYAAIAGLGRGTTEYGEKLVMSDTMNRK